MLKKSVVTSVAFALSVIGAFTLAHAAPVTPKQDSENCYLIGTADELEGFAEIVGVNQTQSNPPNNYFKGCAKLTADIHFAGETRLLNESRTGIRENLDTAKIPKWQPMMFFGGKFDGQGHTIYGLYSRQAAGPSFIRYAVGDSVSIKNLHIADSYFYVTTDNGGAAGLVAALYGEKNKASILTIDRSSFSGFIGSVSTSCDVNAQTLPKNAGLVGYSMQGQGNAINQVILINSYNEGNVGCGAGLLGDVMMKANVTMKNCYNVGAYTTYPLLGSKGTQGNIKVGGENLGCIAAGKDICAKNFNTDANTYAGQTAADVVANFWSNLDGKKTVEEQKKEIAALQESLAEKGMEGVKITLDTTITKVLDSEGNVKDSVIYEKFAVIQLTDTTETLVMPEDVDVYGVKYDRTFNKVADGQSSVLCDGGYNASTTVLPFDIQMLNVTGGKFYQPSKLYKKTPEDSIWTLGLTDVAATTESIQAHTPYVVCPTADHLTFLGGATVKKTAGPADTTKFEREGYTGIWNFIGLYSKKTYSRESSEAGRAYVFKDGRFVRVGNGYSGILRAFLLAPEVSEPVASARSVLAKASVASADVAVEPVQPSSIPVEVVSGAGLRKGGFTDFVDNSLAGLVSDETQSIRNNLYFRKAVKSDKLHDLKGRKLSSRPTFKGVYLNHNIPVVVK